MDTPADWDYIERDLDPEKQIPLLSVKEVRVHDYEGPPILQLASTPGHRGVSLLDLDQARKLRVIIDAWIAVAAAEEAAVQEVPPQEAAAVRKAGCFVKARQV